MSDPKLAPRSRAHNSVSLQIAAFAFALIPFANGCRGPAADEPAVTVETSALVAPNASAPPANGVPAAAPAKTPPGKAALAAPPSTAPAKPTVWVILKSQVNPAPAAQGKDWKGKGQAVFNTLTANASSSQASLKGFLGTRNAKFKSFWIVNTVKVTADQQTIDEIAKRSDVARVVPDSKFTLPPLQPNAGQINVVEWNIANIHAPEVWEQFGARGDGIVVANIDTGVQFDHPALVNQYRGNLGDGIFNHNYSWFDPANVCGFPSVVPCDNVFHGTHTMGTMVGDDLSGNQIGVAPAARWIAAKGCETNSCSFDSLLSAGQWVLAPTDLNGQNPRPDLRPHIVNNSWGGGPGDVFYQATVQAWVAAGIFPAFSNGNAGPSCGSAGSPGDYPESYAVGAYDINNFLGSFSSRGPGFDGGIKPNIAAPGVDVRSSVPGNGYEIVSGTSMAAPHVAGSIALLWSAAPTLVGDIAATRALLDQTAIDTPDFSCGGTAENNNAFGQGRLDVLAAMNQAPTGPTGTLQGTVTANGTPIARASIHAQGPADRTTVSDPAGAYRLRLPAGAYTLTVDAFGYETLTIPGVNIVADTTTTRDAALVPVPSFRLSGTLVDNTGVPVVGGQVSVVGTPLAPAVTDAAGHYNFPAIPAGTYDVTGSAPGGCYTSSTTVVTLTADTTANFTIDLRPDPFGYFCRLTTSDYFQANTPTGLFGDDALAEVPLPFNFPFYSSSFSSVNVTTNGVVNFQPTFAYYGNVGIPDPFEPNAAIFTFWDDLFVDSTSMVNTDTFGTAPNRVFVVEWRDVSPLGRPDLRMSFEVQLGESGSIVMRYQNVEPDPFQRGGSASIGIEDETGTTGLQFAFMQPILANNLAVSYILPPSGFVRGTITDADAGTPVPGATVTALQGTAVIRQTSADGNGAYVLHLPVGAYTIEATATNYSVERRSVNVTLNADVQANFALHTGRAAVTPPNIQLTVPVNQSRTRQLTLSNTGSAGFTFTINESGGARQTTVSTVRLAKNPSFSPNARDTRALFAPGIQATGMAPLAAGDVLKSFPPTGMGFAWGVGFTSNLWLSDVATPFRDVEFTVDGAATGRQFLIPWVDPLGFGADLAYVPNRGLLCQVNVGGDNGIYCMDPATGNVVSSITGAFAWTGVSQRGLAYRSDDDSFYIAGWNDGTVYHVAGLASAQPGEVLGTCRPGDGNISGLAYNSSAGVLWAATNSPTDTIYELNPSDCTVLSTLAHPQPGFQGGGLEMDDAGNLWMIAQSPNRVFLVDSGVPAFSDVPWLSVSPTTGTVAPGTQRSLTVSVNTTGLTPGLYLASIFVGTTAAHQTQIRVPVSLYVPDYQQSVNAGSGVYVDTLGDPWAADQKYATGSWGYVQKGKVVTTSKNITGTPDQPLFRTQRSDPYGYRYDNVPNGTYQVELRFAELEPKEKIGKRLFDVIVEDSLILPAHDIVYEVGTLAAESRTFFLNVTDGRMDIRLIPRAGSDAPVINAARITHRTDR